MSIFLDTVIHRETARFLAAYIKKNQANMTPTLIIPHMLNDYYGTQYTEQQVQSMLEHPAEDHSKTRVSSGPVT